MIQLMSFTYLIYVHYCLYQEAKLIYKHSLFVSYSFPTSRILKFITFSQVYNSKQHEMQIFQHSGNFTVGLLTVVYF